MIIEELAEHWKEYTLISLDNKRRKRLKDIFMICWGHFDDGLLFDAGGPQGAPGAILKCDGHDNCYVKIRKESGENIWVKCGVLKKIPFRVALIACAKNKKQGVNQAKDLYTSTLFTLAFGYTAANFHDVFILSAKHGLLNPHKRIKTYDLSLRSMPPKDRQRWARRVAKQIRITIPSEAEIHFFCGERYREFLIPLLAEYTCHVRLQGLKIGKQLQWYKSRL